MVQIIPFACKKSVPNTIYILGCCQFSNILFRSILPVCHVDKSQMGNHQPNQLSNKLYIICVE